MIKIKLFLFAIISRAIYNGHANSIDIGQTASDYDADAKLPWITGYYRIEVHFNRMIKYGEANFTGSSYDMMNECHMRVRAFVDTENPDADFSVHPGHYGDYALLQPTQKINSTIVLYDKIVYHDVCGRCIRKKAVRVVDWNMSAEKRSHHKCINTGQSGLPAYNESIAKWSSEVVCSERDSGCSEWYHMNNDYCRRSSVAHGHNADRRARSRCYNIAAALNVNSSTADTTAATKPTFFSVYAKPPELPEQLRQLFEYYNRNLVLRNP